MMLLSRLRGAAPAAPRAFTGVQSSIGFAVPLLALGVDALAFYPVLAVILPSLRWYFLVVVAVGLAAGAVWLSDRIGLGWRQRRASDPARSDGLTLGLLAVWTGAGVVMFLARLNLGSDPASLEVIAPVGGSARDIFGAVTFAVLYVISGAIAMAAAYWLYRPARVALAEATAAREAAQKHRNTVQQRPVDEDLETTVEEARKLAPRRRAALQYYTEVDVRYLKVFARHEMASTVKDPYGLALPQFLQDLPEEPEPPKDWP